MKSYASLLRGPLSIKKSLITIFLMGDLSFHPLLGGFCSRLCSCDGLSRSSLTNFLLLSVEEPSNFSCFYAIASSSILKVYHALLLLSWRQGNLQYKFYVKFLIDLTYTETKE